MISSNTEASSLNIHDWCTAIIDIFVWAQLFAVFTDFQTCEGGIFTGKPYVCFEGRTGQTTTVD